MSNVYKVADDIFRFQVWNFNADQYGLAGHFTFWIRRSTKEFVLGQHGGFGCLTWFPKVELRVSRPSKVQVNFLKPIIEKELKFAVYWDGSKINGCGEYFWEETKNRFDAGEYFGIHSPYVWEVDTLITNEDKEIDRVAVGMLGGN